MRSLMCEKSFCELTFRVFICKYRYVNFSMPRRTGMSLLLFVVVVVAGFFVNAIAIASDD